MLQLADCNQDGREDSRICLIRAMGLVPGRRGYVRQRWGEWITGGRAVSSPVYDRPMARWMPAIIGASWLLGVPLQAHHAISTFYDTGRRVTIEAIVRELHFVNPHPFVLSDVRSRDGATEQWRLEMDNRRELVEIGFTHQTLRPGDTIVVAGSPARHEARSLYVRRIDRPSDGFWYEQVGTTPRIRPQ